jgi:hypothetical protein
MPAAPLHDRLFATLLLLENPMRCLLSALVLFSLLAASRCVDATGQESATTPVPLRWKFTSGENFVVSMVQDMSMNVRFGEQDVTTQASNKTWMDWRTIAVDAGGTATIESKVTRMLMEVANPAIGQFTIDTDKPAAEEGQAAMIDKMIRPMVGITFTNKMAPDGKVTDVEIPEEALAGVRGAPGGGMMSADQMAQMIQNISPTFPAKGLSVGQSWEAVADVNMPFGVMTTTSEYTYRGTVMVQHRPLHRIDVKTHMKIAVAEGQPRLEIGEQSSSGTMWFDQESGRLSRSDIEQEFTIEVSVLPGQTMRQKVVQKVSNVIEPKP